MKKVLLLMLLFLATLSFAQEDSIHSDELFAVEALPETIGWKSISDKCEKLGESPIKGNYYKENIYILEDYMLCNDGASPQFYYKIFNGDDSFYIPVNAAKVVSKGKSDDQAKIKMSQMSGDRKDFLSSKLRKNKEVNENIKVLEKQLEEIKADDAIIDEGIAVLKNPFVILDFSFPGEYSIGFNVKFYNNSTSRIKYVYFTLAGYNGVDDRVLTYAGQSTASRTGVGPVEPDESVSWDFESIWPSNQFDSGKILSVTVQYFNGTKKTISKVGTIVLDEEYLHALDRLKKYSEEHPDQK